MEFPEQDDLHLSEYDVIRRSLCYICRQSLLLGDNVWLMEGCGHVLCGRCHDDFYHLECYFCYSQDGMVIKV